MIYLAIDCGCPCTADEPCAAGFSSGGTVNGSAAQTDNYDVAGSFVSDFELRADLAGSTRYTYQILADGVVLYTHACTSSFVTAYVTIPAGTSTITVSVTNACGGPDLDWSYELICTGAA